MKRRWATQRMEFFILTAHSVSSPKQPPPRTNSLPSDPIPPHSIPSHPPPLPLTRDGPVLVDPRGRQHGRHIPRLAHGPRVHQHRIKRHVLSARDVAPAEAGAWLGLCSLEAALGTGVQELLGL